MNRVVKMRLAVLLGSMVAFAAVLAGCGSGSSGSQQSAATGGSGSSEGGIQQAATPASDSSSGGSGGKHLLWVQPMRAHPVHKIMQAGFLNECKKLGYSCDIVGNDSSSKVDIPGSISLAKTAMSKTDYQGVGVYALDPGIYPLIKEVGVDKKLPVVSWHFPLDKGSVPGLAAITGTKPADYARQAADAMGKALSGKGTVAVTQGSYNPTENLVSKTFTQQMAKDYPNVTVLKPALEDFEPSAAVSKATGILQAHPDVTGAFSTTGNGSETWSGAERQTGKHLTIISMDYVRQNLDLVKSGKVYAIVAQPLYQEGAKTADLLAQMADGKSTSYYNWLPAPIVTKDKLDPYYAFLKQAGE
jgi:ribose transport system substrate-binding protein